VSAAEPGRWSRRRPRSRPAVRRAAPVRLVTRLVVAQAAAAAAVGLAFSRRHLPSVLITLALVLLLCVLAFLVRSGARGAWLTAVGFESVFFVYGVSRFVVARYVGGTLFAFRASLTLAPGQTVTLEEIVAYLRDLRIATFKLPERLELRDELPRNPLGKILKRDLRDELR